MKRLINIATLVALVASLVIFGWRQHSAFVDRSAPTAISAFAIGSQKEVRFRFDPESLQGFSDDALEDQLRDWLLYSLIAESGADANAIRDSMYDLPPTRAGYMHPVGAFDFGPVRFRVIDSTGTTVALIPEKSAQRNELIAQVADAVRVRLGTQPRTLQVFEYRIDPVEFSAQVTRTPDIAGAELATPAFGYVQADVRSAADLEAFLKDISHLVSVERQSAGVRVTGRRLASQAGRRLRLEDVAALWQSEKVLSANRRRFDELEARWNDKTWVGRTVEEMYRAGRVALLARYPELAGALRERGSNRLDGSDELEELFEKYSNDQTQDPLVLTLDQYRLGRQRESLHPQRDPKAALREFKAKWEDPSHTYAQQLIQARYDREVEELRNSLNVKGVLHVADGSGFSLDPSYNYTRVRQILAHYRPALRAQVAEHELADAEQGLASGRENKFLEVLYDLSQKLEGKKLSAAIEDDLHEFASFQHARYDGELKGTEVGMVLFYTDLLAKIWALDYVESAPDKPYSANWVRGFVPLLKLTTSPIYQQEINNHSNTRLWFGPRDNAFSKTPDSLLFARIATRVYAASSNSLQPGKEAEANAESAAFLGWWNDHYEQIADFEPEYHRLNEIMKWSTALAWLSGANDLESLQFLEGVQVDRSSRFPQWAKANRDLRFRDWSTIEFLPAGYEGVDTESLNRLYSRAYRSENGVRGFSGGVSLASREKLLARPQVHADIEPLLRRANADAVERSAEGLTLRSLDQTAYTLRASQARGFSVAEAKATTKLRGRDFELQPGAFKLEFERSATGLRARVNVNEKSIGELLIDARGGRTIDVTFRPLEIEQARAFSKTLSRATAQGNSGAKALAARTDVKTVIEAGNDTFYVESTDFSGKWLKIMPEGQPRMDLVADVDLRFASQLSEAGGRGGRWNVAIIDSQKAETELAAQGRYLTTAPADAPESGVAFSISPRGPPASAGPHIDLYSLPADQRKVFAAVADTRKRIGRGGGGGGTSGNGRGNLFEGDGGRRELLRQATEKPEATRIFLAESRKLHLEHSVSLMREGKFLDARIELDTLARLFPYDFDVQAHRVIAHAASRSPVAAAEAARLPITLDQLPSFLDAADTALPKLIPGSAESHTLDAIVRGVAARARGLETRFIQTRGELGIEIRLAEMNWDAPPQINRGTGTVRYSLEMLDPNISGQFPPVPPASTPITGRLRDVRLAHAQPEVIVDAKAGTRYRRNPVTDTASAPSASRSWRGRWIDASPNTCSSQPASQHEKDDNCADEIYLTAPGDARGE